MDAYTPEITIMCTETDDLFTKELRSGKQNFVLSVKHNSDVWINNNMEYIKYIRINNENTVTGLQSFIREITDISRIRVCGNVLYVISWDFR